MAKRYGPWATSIDAGSRAELSTFWRRRLTMLLPASQTSAIPSRRSLVCLVAIGALLLTLPTFYSVAAVAEDVNSAGAPSANEPKASEKPNSDKPRKDDESNSAAKAAQAAYEAAVEAYSKSNGDIESVYRWSSRWMQADVSARGAAAVQSHLDRMQMLCDRIAKLHELGAKGGEETSYAAARYYVLEAKDMLQRMKGLKSSQLAAAKAGKNTEKSATPRHDREMTDWNRMTWRIAIDLDAATLDPAAVQFAILDEDPLATFNAEIKKMYAYYHDHEQQAENAQLKKIQRTSAMTVSWNAGFRKVTGSELYLLTGGAAHSQMMSSNGRAGKKWIVTKTVNAEGTLTCWCLPVEVKKGKSIHVTLTEKNAFDLEKAYDNAMKAAEEAKDSE